MPFPPEVDQRVCSTRIRPLRAIRLKCGACMGGEPDRMPLGEVAQAIAECGSVLCPLWMFRFGTDPFRAGPTEKQRAAGKRLAADRLSAGHGENMLASSAASADLDPEPRHQPGPRAAL